MIKCPGNEARDKAKNIFTKFSEIYDKKIDKIWDKGAEFLRNAESKIAQKSPFLKEIASLRSYAKEIDEFADEIKRARMMINAKSARIKESLSNLSKSDNESLVKALDGMIEPHELPTHLTNLYSKIRTMIDNNAKELVEAGALREENVIKNYIKHYFKESFSEKKSQMKLGFDRLFKRKNLTNDEKIALGILSDPDLAIANTFREQKEQLLKAKMLKAVADKFGKDHDFEGAKRVSDESVGGGIKKYGALAGKYVDKDTYKALVEAELVKKEMNKFFDYYFKLVDELKLNVTVKNPFTHIYNIGSNIVLSYLHGDMKALVNLAKMAKFDKAGFKKLRIKADELGLNSMLDDLEVSKFDLQKNGIVMNVLKNLYMSKNSKTGKIARNLYDWEDKIFKLARFKKNIDAGMDDIAAMKDAQWAYVDYGAHYNATLKLADKSGFAPFLHYSIKSTPMVVKTILKHPVRFALFQTAIFGSGASAFLGDNESENFFKPKWAESKAFPNLFGMKSWTRLPTPGWYLNAGRLVPGFRFDGFDKLEFTGGFLFGAGNIIAMGKSPLGYSFEGEDDSFGTRVFKRVREMARNYMPPITFGRYGMQMAEKSASKIAPKLIKAPLDYNKDELSYTEILARGVGVREFNEKKEASKRLRKTKKALKEAAKNGNNEKIKALRTKFDEQRKAVRDRGTKIDKKLLQENRDNTLNFGIKKIKIFNNFNKS